MNAEHTYFLSILSDFINEQPSGEPPEAMDWAALVRLARTHQVDSIVFHQCQSFMPPEQKAFCAKGYTSAIYFYHNRVCAVEKIGQAFSSAGIDWCTVKGLEVARFYPLPALRTMGDCDMVVGQGHMLRAKEIMRTLGYNGPEKKSPHDWSCDCGDLHFELHDQLVKIGEHATAEQQRYFNHVMEHVQAHKVDENFQFLFVLMHLCKHMMHKGVGIRQFLDVAAMIKNDAELDWQLLEHTLEKLDMRRFAHSCYSLIESWFGVRAPVEFARLDDAASALISKIIMANGIFGTQDENDPAYWAQNALILKKGPRWVHRLSNLLFDLFPSYALMADYPGCGFVKGRKYLLPLAWILRFFLLLFRGNFEKAGNTVRQNFIPEMSLREREQYLEQMGLSFSKKEV